MEGVRLERRGSRLWGSVLAALIFFAGCARTPEGAHLDARNRLVVHVEMAGEVNPSFSYFVAITATDGRDTSHGPLPVVDAPWGNGWGAGVITHFVRVGSREPRFYRFYKLPQTGNPATDLLSVPVPIGGLVATESFQNTRTFGFVLDLDQILTREGTPAPYLNLNIIATDIVPENPYDPVRKQVDSLGPPSAPNFIGFPVTQAKIFDNQQDSTLPESAGDAGVDPALDIANWTIEVQRVSGTP